MEAAMVDDVSFEKRVELLEDEKAGLEYRVEQLRRALLNISNLPPRDIDEAPWIADKAIEEDDAL
jgi:hypothetical protein